MEQLNQTATERRRITRNRIYRYLYAAPQGRAGGSSRQLEGR